MHHYFEAITNNKGDALTGYYVRLVDSGGAGVTLYADSSLTPIVSVSGLADAAKVDADGNVDIYVATGTYTLNIYATDGTTLVRSVRDVGMNIDMDTAATAIAAQAAAEAAEAAAATSESNAATSATASATSATNSATSATASANSATASANSATASANSATASAASQALSTSSYNAIAAAIAPGALTNATVTAATRSILAGLSTALPAFLAEAGREGVFVFSSSNLSAAVTADTQQGVYVAPASAPTGASGAWVRTGNVINPTMFGAVTLGASVAATADSATALQALFTFWAANANYVLDWNGVYVIRSGLTLGSANDRRIRGNLTLYADAAMDNMFTMNTLRHLTASGRLTLIGTGSTWATRTVGTGLLLLSCFSCKLPDIHLDTFKYYGLNTTRAAGSPDNTIDHLHAANCGSGIGGTTASLTSTWNTPVSNAGSITTQRTTITVGTMFPSDYITTHNASTILDAQLLAYISGQYYQVMAYDGGLGTLDLFPWLDPADVATASGTLTYVMGASDRWLGGNSDVNRINNAVLQSNGRGHTQCSLYGNSIGTMESVNSGIAMSLAAGNTNILWGFDIGFCYTESNNCDLMVGGTLTYGHIHGFSEIQWATVKYFPSGRDTTATSGDRYKFQNLLGVALEHKGRRLAYEKDRRKDVGVRANALNIDQAFRNTVFQVSGALSWSIPAPDAFAQYKNDLFGYDSCGLILLDLSGTNYAPTGAQTFIPPSASYTINGGAAGASYVMSVTGLAGPASIAIQYDHTTLNYTVALVNQNGAYNTTQIGYATGAGGTVTQLTSKATGVTLSKYSGQITTHNAALAAGAVVGFTLTNTKIAATDMVIVNIGSGASANSYTVTVDAVAAGSCHILLHNVSAGSLSEVLVLNFAVLKAVNA